MAFPTQLKDALTVKALCSAMGQLEPLGLHRRAAAYPIPSKCNPDRVNGWSWLTTAYRAAESPVREFNEIGHFPSDQV